MVLQALAGASLGVLLGLLLGLSNSPVVAVVVGALASGLLMLLGFVPAKGDEDSAPEKRSLAAARMTGFGFACAIALLCGVYFRAHDFFTPTPAQQVQQLLDAKFTDTEAHSWVAYRNAGLLLRLQPDAVLDKDDKHAYVRSNSTVLMASNGVDNCALVTPSTYGSTSAQMGALRAAGATFAKLADTIEALPQSDRDSAFKVLQAVYCQ